MWAELSSKNTSQYCNLELKSMHVLSADPGRITGITRLDLQSSCILCYFVMLYYCKMTQLRYMSCIIAVFRAGGLYLQINYLNLES